MTREPMTRRLDADEVMRFLDQVVAESTKSQRLPVSLGERAPSTPCREPHRSRQATRTSSQEEPPTTTCAAELAGGTLAAASSAPLVHQRPRLPVLELTMLDAGWTTAERRSGHARGRRQVAWPRGRRWLVGGLAGASLLLLLLAGALRVRRDASVHALAASPAPLPVARAHALAGAPRPAAQIAPRASEPAAYHDESPSAQPGDPPPPLDSADDVASAEPSAQRGLAIAAPRDAVPPRATSQRAPDSQHVSDQRVPDSQRSPGSQSAPHDPGAQGVRDAVDLLLSGHTRAALDAYRGLALAPAAPPVLSELVRLLEREQQTCDDRGSPCGL